MIFPLRVLGKASVKRIWSGVARAPICFLTAATSCFFRSSDGLRPLRKEMHLRFRYRIDGADSMQIKLVLDSKTGSRAHATEVKKLRRGEWAETVFPISSVITFTPPAGVKVYDQAGMTGSR